jgi:hypothetical protein
MKMAKIYLSLIISCFLASVCPAQNIPSAPPPPPNSSAKEIEKWNKKQQKINEKNQAKSRKEKKKSPPIIVVNYDSSNAATRDFDIVTTPEKVTPFFNEYVGKIIKFESHTIFQIEAVRGTNEEIYGIDVNSLEKRYSKSFSPYNELNFIMSATLAREVMQEQEEWLTKFPQGKIRRLVNIFAEMRRGENEAKIAYILCVEFTNKSTGIPKSVGSCQ